jgi:hypothetical protein
MYIAWSAERSLLMKNHDYQSRAQINPHSKDALKRLKLVYVPLNSNFTLFQHLME